MTHRMRSDAPFIRYIHNKPGVFHPSIIPVYQALPLVVLTPAQAMLMVKSTGGTRSRPDLAWNALRDHAREGMYLLQTRGDDEDIDEVDFYLQLRRVNDNSAIVLDVISRLMNVSGKEAFGYVLSFFVRTSSEAYKRSDKWMLDYNATINQQLLVPEAAAVANAKLKERNFDRDGMSSLFAMLIDIIGGMYYYLQHIPDRELRPVAKRDVSTDKTEKKSTKKKPWLRSDLTEIRFLDHMPRPQPDPESSNDNNGGRGTHASPKKHFRQAGRRTLRHPRFRNHPLYQVEGGITVRATWVGVKEDEPVIVNGTEYRLLAW